MPFTLHRPGEQWGYRGRAGQAEAVNRHLRQETALPALPFLPSGKTSTAATCKGNASAECKLPFFFLVRPGNEYTN